MYFADNTDIDLQWQNYGNDAMLMKPSHHERPRDLALPLYPQKRT